MHKFARYAALFVFGLVSSVQAEVVNGGAKPTDKPDRVVVIRKAEESTEHSLSFLKLASVGSPGEVMKSGDLIKVSRKFVNWTLHCDVRLSTNRRVRSVEQSGHANGNGLVWRIAMNERNRPVAVLSMPSGLDMARGVRMKFAGLEKTLDQQQFKCGSSACIGGFYFDGFVQDAITTSKKVSFSFTPASGENVEVTLSMTGFSNALEAGATDPFGRDITRMVAKKIKDNPGRKSAAKKTVRSSKLNKPSAKAKKSIEADTITGNRPGLF